MPNRDMNLNSATKGMNLDLYALNNDTTKAYIKAFNARQESIDGEELQLTNEPSNEECIKFPEGYTLMGSLVIPELLRTYYWIVNPSTSNAEIGVSTNVGIDSCNYTSIVKGTSTCLSIDVRYPIHKITYKLTNKSLELYWTNSNNDPKWINLNDIKRLPNGELDCNQLKIFPDFKTPCIRYVETQDSGSLKAGGYQFFVAYANSKGEELSQYYSATNSGSIWENQQTNLLDFETAKAILINISNIDTTFSKINIAVGKNINMIESFDLIGTFDITGDSFEFLYTGNDKVVKPLTTADIFARYPFYASAETLASQNNILMLGGLKEEEVWNLQPIINKVRGIWGTWRVPYNQFEGYSNSANTANLRGAMRDEVYPYEIALVLKSGRITNSFHWPGPGVRPEDRVLINNADAINTVENPCDPLEGQEKWKVYNTANVLGKYTEWEIATDKKCYKGPYEYGEFASWESDRTYPNNPEVWGSLAGQKIRHWKYPDNIISHIHDTTVGFDLTFEHAIYPIGIQVDINSLQQAIKDSNLTQEQKESIVGFKVVRGNRAGNKSVVAKGLLYNSGTYTRDGESYLYPNYPYNDLSKDPFISNKAPQDHDISNSNNAIRLDGFANTDISKTSYTLHSPDLSFVRPRVSGYLKLETAEFGKSKGHFVEVLDNAKYALGTQKGIKSALAIGLVSILNYTAGFPQAAVSIKLENFLPTFQNAYSLIKTLIPFRQYGYQFNSIGLYNNFVPIPNTGNKIRRIVAQKYLDPGMIAVENEAKVVNNFQRESSVFLKTNSTLPFPHEITGVPRDNSRYTLNSIQTEVQGGVSENGSKYGRIFYRDISSYYASIKVPKPDQYGNIYSYKIVDTGLCYNTFDINKENAPAPIAFGGDTYINRFGIKRKLPFFFTNTVGMPDDTDVFYDQLGNVGFPTYYLSTGPKSFEISQNLQNKLDKAYDKVTDTSFKTGAMAAITAGLNRFIPGLIALVALVEEITNKLGIKNTNLDQYRDAGWWEEGLMYLFAYGIPYFFVESDINVDYRQAENGTDKNFYPNVGTDIPDFWLQEKNTSITKDNFYLYNKSFNKQNIEGVYTHLPLDWNQARDGVTDRSTRIIYSQPSNMEERQNNWIIFRANNYKDFPLENGRLVDLNAIEKEQVLVRFENNSALYNAYITLDTSNKTGIIGTGEMFSAPPIEFSKTDIGYTGTQHKNFDSTKYGHFWVDAKRGNVFLLQNGEGLKDISQLGMMNWFKENLPFKITKYFPDVPIDNSFQGVGITTTWDNKYDRYFLTKKDFVPLDKNIKYDKDTQTFRINSKIISLEDKNFFCNASWTAAYSPKTESWASFFTWYPDHYIGQNNFFQTVKKNSVWEHHLLDDRTYQIFFGEVQPFSVETLGKTDIDSRVLQSVGYRCEAYKYFTNYQRLLKPEITFNKARIYDSYQTSGDLILQLDNKKDMRSGLLSQVTDKGIIISLAEADKKYKFNRFYNLTKDGNDKPLILFGCANTEEVTNPDAVDYKNYNRVIKDRLRGDWFRIKLTNDIHTDYKFIFKWLLDKSIKSVR